MAITRSHPNPFIGSSLTPQQVYVRKNAIKAKQRQRALMLGIAQENMTDQELIIWEIGRDVGYLAEEIPAEITNSYEEMGLTHEMIEVTCLSDDHEKFVAGRQLRTSYGGPR